MARSEIHQHPKFYRLCKCLGEPEAHCLGYLEMMWHACYASHSPVLGDAEDVELAAKYPGHEGALFEALKTSRFIVAINGHWAVKDLYDHCPDYVKKRLRTRMIKEPEFCLLMLELVPSLNDWVSNWSAEELQGLQNVASRQSAPNGAEPREKAYDTTQQRHNKDTTKTQQRHNTKDYCPEPQAASGPKKDESPTVLIFPIKGGEEWHLTEAKFAEYEESFPDLDVMQVVRSARQWLRDNPTKRKTARGMPRALTGWLNREQNRGTSRKAASGGTNETTADRMRRMFDEEGQG